MTALAGRGPAALQAYAVLLARLAADLATLRLTSSNLGTVDAHLRRVELHVGAELAALARNADRGMQQRERLAGLRRP